MSEKIYAWLLRLYPSNFQKAYGEEALQLFRDRARDERGFLPSLRLWLDLLIDLAISIPRRHQPTPVALAVSRTEHGSDGLPSFHSLKDEALSAGSLLYGGIASLVVYGSILLLIGQGGKPFSIPTPDIQQAATYSATIGHGGSDIRQPGRHSGTIAKPTPTVRLSYLAANPASGSMVNLSVTVLAAGAGPAPTGNVRFFDGSAVLSMGKLNHGAVTVQAKLPYIATHSLSAIYYGDANYSSAGSNGKKE